MYSNWIGSFLGFPWFTPFFAKLRMSDLSLFSNSGSMNGRLRLQPVPIALERPLAFSTRLWYQLPLLSDTIAGDSMAGVAGSGRWL
jgi:hypothetical protein